MSIFISFSFLFFFLQNQVGAALFLSCDQSVFLGQDILDYHVAAALVTAAME